MSSNNQRIKPNIPDWISKLLYSILFVVTIIYVVAYLAIALSRIKYPFELEWMEGAMVDHVRRILAGEKLYVAPSLEFIPYLYPPLYFYLSALISSVIGIGFLPLRFISFVSSLGCFFVIFLIVQKETQDKFSGIMASSLYAATYKLSGAWFDISRIDSLFLFFLLSAIYFVRFGNSIKEYIFAGVLISLSFLTKQTALIISLPIMLYVILINRRYAVFFICTTIFIIGISTIILNHIHNGWYKYYIFDLAGQHPLEKEMIFGFWNEYILPLKIAFVMAIFYLISMLFNKNRQGFLFYSLSFMGMIGASWVGLLHKGGFSNVLMPAYSGIAILFGMAFHTLFEFIKPLPENNRKLLGIFIYLICILQFGSGALRYNPAQFIPTKMDLEAGRKFINTMAQIEGEVFIPDHGYLPTLAGKKSYAHAMAIDDVLKSKGKIKENLVDEIKKNIREKKYSAIILDGFEPFCQREIEKYYERTGSVFNDETVFFPVTAIKKRPEFIYIPKR